MATDSKRTQHGKRGGNSKAGSAGRDGLNKRDGNANKHQPAGGSSQSHVEETARSRAPAKDD